MRQRLSRRGRSPDQGGRGRSRGNARLLLRVLPGVLAALVILSGCGRREAPPAHLGQWPVASCPDFLGLSTHIAWVSPQQRTEIEMLGHDDPVSVPGQVTAICRIPALDYDLPADAPLRFGFLIFHEGGASYSSDDPGATGSVPLAIEGVLSQVRAAACLSPGDGDHGEVVALITGGQVPPRASPDEAETPPWVTSAEVQLAWLQGGRLIVGSPEPLAGTNPWALRVGKFAGEEDNLLISVYSGAPFDQVTRRRPWIYRVVRGGDGLPHLDPRWRGTSFSRPFRDATFGDFTGEREGEIAALEVDEDGDRLLTAYRFRGFGLEGLAPSVELPPVSDRLEAAHWSGRAADELVVRAADGRFLFFEFAPDTGELREVLAIQGPAAVLGWAITSATDGEPGDLVCVLPTGEVWRTDSSQRGAPPESRRAALSR